MKHQLNTTVTLSSKKLNPQKKTSESIIPLKLASTSLKQPPSSQQSILKQKPQKDILSQNPPSSDLQGKNSAQIQINQPTQNINHKALQNVGVRPKTAVKSSVSQNILIEALPKKPVRPTTANLSQPKKPIRPMTVNSDPINLSRQTQPQNKLTKPLSASVLLIDSKNKQVKSTFKQTKSASTQQKAVSMIQQQNNDKLKDIKSAKSTFPKQIISKSSQSGSQQTKLQSQSIIPQNLTNKQLMEEEEEEEKEGFDINKREGDRHLEEIEIFSSEKNVKALEQLESSSLKLLPLFFDVMNNTILLTVANFLTIQDFIKLTYVSRLSRSFVAMALKKIDYQMNIDDYLSNKSKQEYCAVESLSRIQKNFNSFFKKQDFEKEFLLFIGKNASDKSILEILKAGMIYSDIKHNQNIDVISNIKRKGLFNCFSGINLPFVALPKLIIGIPPFKSNKTIQCEQFIKVILKYVELSKTNRVSIKLQKQASKQTEIFQMRSKFMENKLKLLAIYEKPIQRLKKNSNLFGFLNINTLQNIITFLTFKEIAILLQSEKAMREVVKQAVQHQLAYLESQREKQLLSFGMQPEFGNGILYAKQFELFERDELTYISSDRFSFAPLCEQLKAICFAVTSKTLEEINTQFQVSPTIMYRIKFSFNIPDLKRLQLINSFLENYPTLLEFKQQQLNEKNIPILDERGCVLLYSAMKGYQKLAQFRFEEYSFEESEKVYSQNISPLDNNIFKYSRLIGKKNEDDLFMYSQFQYWKQPMTFDKEVFPLF